MGPTDVLWHVLNFVAPAIFLGAVSALIAKLAWRRALAAVRWARLATWGSAVSLAALIGGLWVTGRDGSMGTYAAMVLGCAAALAWVGFVRGRR